MRSEHTTRSAELAGLETRFDETAFDVGVVVGLLEPLYGNNLAAMRAKGRHHAGEGKLVIEKHRAEPAFSLQTSRSASLQSEVVSDDVYEQRRRWCLHRNVLTV